MKKERKICSDKDTLCWKCGNNSCSWMNCLEPVAGWTAKKDTANNGGESYLVSSCPGYRKIVSKPLNISACEELAEKIIRSGCRAYRTALIELKRYPRQETRAMARYWRNALLSQYYDNLAGNIDMRAVEKKIREEEGVDLEMMQPPVLLEKGGSHLG